MERATGSLKLKGGREELGAGADSASNGVSDWRADWKLDQEHGHVSVSGRGHRMDRDLEVGLPLAIAEKLPFDLRKEGTFHPWEGLGGALKPSMQLFLKRQPAQNGVTCAKLPHRPIEASLQPISGM